MPVRPGINISMKLSVGDQAPDFSLSDAVGTMHTLSQYNGKWVLLYFYPKDNTPGCTKQACVIRDDYSQFKKLQATVLGVSVDSPESHGKFAMKYELPFTLLADEKKEVVARYDVWTKKKFMGREYMGTLRTSFLISPEGKIVKIYDGVKPETHAIEVLADLVKLQE